MGRPLRSQTPGLVLHVILRGNRRQDIFEETSDYLRFMQALAEIGKKGELEILAVCLMPNHAHILIRCKERPIGRILQGLETSHALYMNRRYGRTGHLFGGRYTAKPSQTDESLRYHVKYIHRNPVRGGLCTSPDGWPWSSHAAYAGRTPLDGLSIDFVLGLFSPDRPSAHRAYSAFMALEPESPRDNGKEGMDAIAKRMEREAGFDSGVICGARGSAVIAALRRQFISAAARAGHKVDSIARFLGRGRSTVYDALRGVRG